MLMRRGSVQLRIKAAENMKLYACNVNGKRLFPMESWRDPDGRLCFTASNFHNDQAICVYELVKETP